MKLSLPLIVGAGPVGLAASLFLAADGQRVRIIDTAKAPADRSRALAVNPRTLEILEPLGITEMLLAIGKPIRGMRLWKGNVLLASVDFEGLHHRYPYMLALSQAVTAKYLESALNMHGVQVERNLSLVGCANQDASVEAVLKRSDETTESVTAPWLLACDGAHSTVRRELNVGFSGSTFDVPWNLVDVPLAAPLDEDRAHVVLLDGGGFLFLIRVVDDLRSLADAPLWRVMGNVPDVLDRFDLGKAAGPAVWTSSFRIAHRIVDQMTEGRIHFAGDAAHLHSPVGARGMNLGIEDAFVFSQLLKQGRIRNYGSIRRQVDRRVVKRIELLSRAVRGESLTSRLLRTTVLPLMTRVPAARTRMIATVTGLDHPILSGESGGIDYRSLADNA